jgi:hypothetical protein
MVWRALGDRALTTIEHLAFGETGEALIHDDVLAAAPASM